MTISTDCCSRSVTLAIKPPKLCNGWSLHFHNAGWRTFYRDVYMDGSTMVWLFKRKASAFVIKQLPNAVLVDSVDLPEDAAEEVCRLLSTSGLAEIAP